MTNSLRVVCESDALSKAVTYDPQRLEAVAYSLHTTGCLLVPGMSDWLSTLGTTRTAHQHHEPVYSGSQQVAPHPVSKLHAQAASHERLLQLHNADPRLFGPPPPPPTAVPPLPPIVMSSLLHSTSGEALGPQSRPRRGNAAYDPSPLHANDVHTVPSLAPAADGGVRGAAEPSGVVGGGPPAVVVLTASQRGELELAAARAARASTSRKPTSKRARQTPMHLREFTSGDDSSDVDSDVELQRLPLEEQERLLQQRLATGANDKDARRLKR